MIQFQDDIKLMYINKLNESLNWSTEKLAINCSEEEKAQANLRSWRNDEIVLDIEDKLSDEATKNKVDRVREKLKRNKLHFTEIESQRNEGRHFHLFFEKFNSLSEELKKEVRKIFIEEFEGDEKALGKYTTIENRPHFKGGKLCKVISEDLTNNELSQDVELQAQMNLNKINSLNLMKETDSNFKEYFEKDELMKFLYELAQKDEIIPDGTSRHMVLLKNIAIACVKSGKSGKDIDTILAPLILKVMPGKTIKDLRTWIKTVEKQRNNFNIYNFWEINSWTKYYYNKEIYKLTIEAELLDKIEKDNSNIYELYKQIMSYFWAEITDIQDKYLKPISKIEDELIRTFLLNTLAFKSGIKQKDLMTKIRDLKEIENLEDPKCILDSMDENNIRKLKYYIYPFIPQSSLITIGARAGQFKTNFVLSLCLGLLQNNNTKYLNTFENHTPTNTKILYYDLETGKENVIRRLFTLVKGLNISKDILKNLSYVEKFNKSRIDLELKTALQHDVIILDSYRRFLKDSENDSETTDDFYHKFLKPLKDAGKTVIMLHHFKKIKFENYTEEELIDAFRGSGDIVAQLDLALTIFKSDDIVEDNKTTFTIDVRKAKNRLGLPFKNFKIQVIKDDNDDKSYITFLSYISGGNSRNKPNQVYEEYIIDLIASKELSRGQIVEACELKFGLKPVTVDKYLNNLLLNGKIVQPRYKYYIKNQDMS